MRTFFLIFFLGSSCAFVTPDKDQKPIIVSSSSYYGTNLVTHIIYCNNRKEDYLIENFMDGVYFGRYYREIGKEWIFEGTNK
jgi:hypothetical protein